MTLQLPPTIKAIDLDRYRQLFPFLKTGAIYMNHAAISPLSTRVMEAIQDYFKLRNEAEKEIFFPFQGTILQTKELLGTLLNCHRDRIAFVDNTSNGLNILANGLPWKSGDRILLNDLEFPANVYPFLNLKRLGVEIDFVKNRDGKIFLEDLEQAITPKTKLLSISFVQFLTGYKADLLQIGELCKRKGIIFCVDAIQGLGAIPVDVQATNIDFLACGGHKWLMADQGIGFIYLTEELQQKVHPAYVGWTSIKNFFNNILKYRLDLHDTARRFENGSLNFIGISALRASVSTLLEVGIENIYHHLLNVTQRLIDGMKECGVTPAAGEDLACRSGIVAFKSEKCQEWFEQLHTQKMEVAVREGYLRISPHFYNTLQEAETILDVILPKRSLGQKK